MNAPRIMLVAAMAAMSSRPVRAVDWTQWGGPTRDFRSSSQGLIEKWASDGPKTLWKRELGEGYSSILAADGMLFTMYRSGDNENVIALSAADGATRWTHTYPAPLLPDSDTNFGKGPNATPALAEGRLVTIGFTGRVFCLDAKSGKPIWSTNLFQDLGGTFLKFGYSSSPIVHDGGVILSVGKKGGSLVSLALSDGKPRWSSGNFENSYSTPILITVGKQKQITLVTPTQIIGLDASSGDMLWSHPYKNQWDTHCTTPVDCGDGRVFYPSFGGGVLLELKASGGDTSVKELWTTKKVGAGQTNVLCVDDHLYGASGSGKAGFFAAVRLKDGEEAWRERVPLATALYADKRLLILDETGVLRMARATPEKYVALCEAPLLENKAWTAPTLDRGRLYLRDQKHILAVDLSGSAQ